MELVVITLAVLLLVLAVMYIRSLRYQRGICDQNRAFRVYRRNAESEMQSLRCRVDKHCGAYTRLMRRYYDQRTLIAVIKSRAPWAYDCAHRELNPQQSVEGVDDYNLDELDGACVMPGGAL